WPLLTFGSIHAARYGLKTRTIEYITVSSILVRAYLLWPRQSVDDIWLVVFSILTKAVWMGMFTFMFYVLARYMSDMYMDILLFDDTEKALINMPLTSKEQSHLDKVVLQIAENFQYPH